MDKYSIMLWVFLLTIGSINVSAGYVNGHSCSNSGECNSGFCAQGFCCNANECGLNSSCYNLNYSYNVYGAFGGADYVCTQDGWKLDHGEGCQTNESCVTGKCLNSVCCNSDECGVRFAGTGCYKLGENFMNRVCVSEGTYKTRNEYSCENNSECASGNCADTVCCNISQCGYNNTCYNTNSSYTTGIGMGLVEHICSPEGWKTGYHSPCQSNDTCITGKCLNEVCCNANECGFRFSGYGCYAVGQNTKDDVCVAEGVLRLRENQSCENNSECASGSCVNNLCAAYTATNYSLNHSCNLSWECASGSCADNVCCNAGQCGWNNRCHNQNQTYQTGMNNKKICTNQGWKMDYSSSCSNNESCVTGRCINNACCNQDQCAMAYMSPLFCKNVGESVRMGASQNKTCVSEGVWETKTTNGYACTNNTECASDYCAQGVCCNTDQCGWNNNCFNQNQTYQTGMRNRRICTSEGWKFDYGQSCTENGTCATGKCINNACCNAGECAYAYMSPVICVKPGAEIRYGPSQNWTCVSEGNWLKKTNNGYSCTNDSECTSNYCVNNTCTATTILPCDYLWWFDNNSTECGYKEFCGAYMYYGLRTFQNQSDCLKELTGSGCVGEGGSKIIYPGTADCCAGLTAINPMTLYANGTCSPPTAGASICAYCGNGVCGVGENWCNCPEDCPQPCADEGEIPQWIITTPNGAGGYYKDCCAGLTKVLDWGYDSDCEKTRTWANAVCVKECGDGACTTGETKCNCPADCNTTTSTTSSTTTTSTTQQACPNGVDIQALGTGGDAPLMQLWINGRLRAQWKTIDYAKHFVYETGFECGANEIDIVHANGTGALYIYGARIGCETFPSATLTAPQTMSMTYYKYCPVCDIAGDYPPCGEISLEEIIDLIESWRTGAAKLVDVINLVESWRNQ